MAYAPGSSIPGVCAHIRDVGVERGQIGTREMNVAAAAATDIGLLRDRNEDRYLCDPGRGIYLVVDGVGGQAAGEVAAETAVEAIRQSDFRDEDSVREAVARANNRIFELAETQPELRGMACVLTLAVARDWEILIGHVGDSRLYLIWQGAIRKLTSDHSPVGEDEDAGELTETEAMRHPRRHEVFRDVGSRRRGPRDRNFVEVRRCRFRPDAAILLCSDGLTDELTAAQVREIAERYDGDAERVARELVEAANHAGGADNITALFVAGPEFRGTAGTATRPRRTSTKGRGRRGLTEWLAQLRIAGSRPIRLPRAVLLAGGLVIGMLVWLAVRR